ncbi:MAG: ABC transporter permease [Acidimicrobiia bacterium]|nr:ABC transporter permease [Acidimicrobiia bacterium]
MILAALRDLQWRWKRFAIAIAATALVFSMSLVMSGLADSFPSEIDRLIDTLGGRSYLAPAGEAGPFTSSSIVATDQAPAAAPMLFWSAALRVRGTAHQAGLFGLPIGWPVTVDDGRATRQNGEVVVDNSLGLSVGSELRLGGSPYRVVGTMNERTLFGGQPLIILTIHDAQFLLAGGAPITRAFIDSKPARAPAPKGLTRFSRSEAAEDLLRPMRSASQSITFVNVLLWLVAICIIGSVVFLSALERSRDFAVFKATGVKSWQMGLGLALQAVVLAVVASLFAIVIALLLAPAFPMPVSIPESSAISLPFIAIGIGVFASLAGLRKTMAADPVDAFGGR